ncbi:MAG: abhydrolase domain-containing 18 [Actinobacteria bacterium]|nr:abhydrolase domain-containing 18 [Actinomycetota bacterium]
MATDPEHVRLPSRDGLPLSALLLPPAPAVTVTEVPGVVVLHGFGSRKENHLDFAGRVADAGMWAVVPDLRGHGETGGPMDEGMIGDVLACLDHLESRGAGPLGLRGSSMGGFLSLIAAPMHPRVGALVALCPAQQEPLARRLEANWPLSHSLECAAWRDDGIARGFWHARGDEVVPWGNTLNLHSRTPQPKHLRIRMGGSHRSPQHDPAVQADTVAFLAEALHASPPTPVSGT